MLETSASYKGKREKILESLNASISADTRQIINRTVERVKSKRSSSNPSSAASISSSTSSVFLPEPPDKEAKNSQPFSASFSQRALQTLSIAQQRAKEKINSQYQDWKKARGFSTSILSESSTAMEQRRHSEDLTAESIPTFSTLAKDKIGSQAYMSKEQQDDKLEDKQPRPQVHEMADQSGPSRTNVQDKETSASLHNPLEEANAAHLHNPPEETKTAKSRSTRATVRQEHSFYQLDLSRTYKPRAERVVAKSKAHSDQLTSEISAERAVKGLTQSVSIGKPARSVKSSKTKQKALKFFHKIKCKFKRAVQSE